MPLLPVHSTVFSNDNTHYNASVPGGLRSCCQFSHNTVHFFLILSKERKKTEPLAVIDFNHEEDSALPDRIKFVAIVPLLIFCFNRGAVFPL